MLRTIDRYVIREVVGPFAIVLLVFTFMLMMQPIMDVADTLIAKGVAWTILLRVLPTLVPQALGVTIPMALLVGLLIALGRLSEDREWVALQACGVSVYRLLRPVMALSLAGALITLYVMVYALPDANQAYNEIIYPVLWSKAETQVKPRTFYQELQPKVLYVRDVTSEGVWKDVFLYDPAGGESIYVAREGRLIVDRARRLAAIRLEDLTQQTGTGDRLSVNQPKDGTVRLDFDAVFPTPRVLKGYNQKTVAELRADIERLEREHLPAVEEPIAIHQKFSIPVACLVFGLIGLALGVSSRRDGKMASFVLGIGVIFAYYALMYGAASLAKSLIIPPWTARWVPNLILGPIGLAVLVWRGRHGERGGRFAWLAHLRRPTWRGGAVRRPVRKPLVKAALSRLPHHLLPRPRILDWYISKLYLRILALTFGGLLVIFYIADFIDVSDTLFKGRAPVASMLAYFFYKTPYFVYFIIPLAALIAALVTLGLLTRNSELVVMKACGISVYRAAVPVLLFAAVAGLALFGLEEDVLASTNRQWQRYRDVFKGRDPDRIDTLNRGWVVSRDGRSIYHFDAFHRNRGAAGTNLYRFSAFTFDTDAWRMTSRLSASFVRYAAPPSPARGAPRWIATNGWMWELPQRVDKGRYVAFKGDREVHLESPDYFGNEQPDAERMNYVALKRYVNALRAGGFYDTKASVQLQSKIAFPFVVLVMTLIAVPFGVTMGRRGAMYGIGLGVVLAIGYWVTAKVFEAFGAGGALPPMLAAWAPNILYSAGAIYLLLTVRT